MMREGKSLLAAARANSISTQLIYDLIDADKSLYDEYARAKNEGADKIADEIVSLSAMTDVDFDADPKRLYAEIQRRKLQTDALKWQLSKQFPRKYGDKLQLGGDSENPIHTQNVNRVELVAVSAQSAQTESAAAHKK